MIFDLNDSSLDVICFVPSNFTVSRAIFFCLGELAAQCRQCRVLIEKLFKFDPIMMQVAFLGPADQDQ